MTDEQKQLLQFIGDKLMTVSIRGQEAVVMTQALQLVADLINQNGKRIVPVAPAKESVEGDNPTVAVGSVN